GVVYQVKIGRGKKEGTTFHICHFSVGRWISSHELGSHRLSACLNRQSPNHQLQISNDKWKMIPLVPSQTDY
ncbi:MAG TPA: hypothetical protein VIJ87_20425, partial [Pyrinomonadaceae bacterium]